MTEGLTIERLPRLDFRTVAVIERREIQREVVCYECTGPSGILYAWRGKLLCCSCLTFARLRSR